MKILNIAGATLNQIPLDWENNMHNIREAIGQARQQKMDILCLPEMCISGYGCEDVFLSEWLYEKVLDLLDEVREMCENITVGLGIPVKFNGKNYSAACLLKDREILGITAKQFLANDGVHYEPRWFTPWPAGEIATFNFKGKSVDFGDIIYEVHGIQLAFEICEDAWSGTNRPACRHWQKGVDLIMNPSASHFAFGKTVVREGLVVGPSEKFECTYIFTNMLGNEAGRMIFDGEILIAQKGRLIAKNNRLSFRNVNLLTATVNFSEPQLTKAQTITDSYHKEVEFIKAESLGLFDYMRKSRSKGFVLSLSGGADSSTCAVLVAEMVRRGVEELGFEHFLQKLGVAALIQKINPEKPDAENLKVIVKEILSTAYQATKNSSEDTFQAAKILATSIGATFYNWHIDEEVNSYTQKIEKAIGRPLTWDQDDVTLQNIQARARSPIIWMVANINNALLLTTSNRSEGDVGYATMDGDTSGGLAPIAAVDKHFIRQWLLWAEKELGYEGLKPVNELNPTAELRPLEKNQTDEDDLMPYNILLSIERLAIRDRFSPVEVYKILAVKGLESNELLKSHINKFFTLWSRNQWKRERTAPAFHLDDFNVDPRTWCRFPILSSGFKEELEEMMKL